MFGADGLRCAAIVAACGAVGAAAGFGPVGTNVNWTNPGDGFFDNGDNWETGAPPGAADVARFDFGGDSAVTFRRAEATRSLRVENHVVTFAMQGFEYSLSDPGPAALSVGSVGAPAATLTLLDGFLFAPSLQVAGMQGEFGRLAVGPGGALLVAGPTLIGGEMRILPAGRFDAGRRIELRAGGRLMAPQVFVGASPGAPARARTDTFTLRAGARVEFGAQYFQDPQGALDLTLSGAGLAPIAGAAGATTTAELAGALITRAAPAFDPPVGSEVPIVAASLVNGEFGVIITPRLPEDRFLTPTSVVPFHGPGSFSLTANSGAATIDLSTEALSLAAGDPVEAQIGDMDLDGDQDVVVASTFGPGVPGQVQIFLNSGVSGGGAWLGLAPGPVVAVGDDPSGLSLGDLDNDGDLDIATSNRGSNNATILLNQLVPTTTLSFTSVARPVGLAPSDVVIAKLTADAFSDIAVSNKGSDSVTILINNGAGAFPTSLAASVDDEPETVDAGDLDNDKDLDIVTTNGGSPFLLAAGGGTVSILLQTPMGFADAVNTSVGAGPTSVAIADLDGDGFADLAVTNNTGASITFLRGNGTASPSLAGCTPLGGQPDSIVSRDVDGDGDPELVALINEQNGRVARLLRNDRLAPGPFVLASAVAAAPTGAPGAALAVGDLNGDGKPDVVVVVQSAGLLRGVPAGAVAPFLAQVVIPEPADLNGDGSVNSADLAILVGSWGACSGCAADLTGDGAVNSADLAQLLGAWT